jgi:CPA1 family monovalent cation:H+ antiporter
MSSLFDTVAMLLVLTACFAWFNRTILHLPSAIGLLLMGLAASLSLIAIESVLPHLQVLSGASQMLRQIDFSHALLDGMLGFLLFAGALHVDISELRDRKWVVASMATIGVLISTIAVGIAFWAVASRLGYPMSLWWAFVFGALISPTDPVAVLNTIKDVDLPEHLRVDIAGESLFNDGVGIVFFTVLLAIASSTSADIGAGDVLKLFMQEAVGGAALGAVTGYLAYRAMRLIDDYPTEVLISIALVTGTYALASKLHVSGAISVVVAGVLIGNRGAALAMSDVTRRYLFGFWNLIDQMLNSVLFLLIGLEVILLQFNIRLVPLALAAIPIVLGARFLAVALPVTLLRPWSPFAAGTIPVMTWSGLRGGISIALALSLTSAPDYALILAATYTVAVFTIVVQGLSLCRLITWLGIADGPSEATR